MSIEDKVKSQIRDIPNFPKEGILFKDITPLLANPELTSEIADALLKPFKNQKVDAIMGIESRGFFWGLLLAQLLKVPFVPVRKQGKLPYKTIKHKYDLEYGSAVIEVHEGTIVEGSNVLIHDDLLATGGTAEAAARLVELSNANVVGFSFLVILNFLKGRDVLSRISDEIHTIVEY